MQRVLRLADESARMSARIEGSKRKKHEVYFDDELPEHGL
jgi:hypothetical protein